MSIAMETVFPAVMEQKLRRIRRRQLAFTLGRAVLLAGCVFLVGMFAAMCADAWMTLFDPLARLGLAASVWVAALATLLCLSAPVLKACALHRAAGDADREVPQLEQRWSTVASFSGPNRIPTSVLMQAMLRQVTSEAVALAELVEPARISRSHRVRRAAYLFAAAAAITIVFLAGRWQYHRVLLQRFWSPLTPITATQLECLSRDVLVPRGDSVQLAAHVTGLSRDAGKITLMYAEGKRETFALRTAAERPNELMLEVPAVKEPLRYRIEAGDARTAWYAVTPIDRPALDDVRFAVVAPAYANRPPYEKDYLPERVQALEGSHLQLELKPATRLQRLELAIARTDPATGETSEDVLVPRPDADGWYRIRERLVQDTSLRLSMLSPQGLTSDGDPACHIRVVPDRAPVARLIRPEAEMSVSPEEVVDIQFEAHDDHGIAAAELIIYDDSRVQEGAPPEILDVVEIPLGEQELAQHVSATAQLNLAPYEFAEGTQISFAVRVTDNRSTVPATEHPTVDLSPQPSRAARLENATGVPQRPDAALEQTRVAADASAFRKPDQAASGEEPAASTIAANNAGQSPEVQSADGGDVEPRQTNPVTNDTSRSEQATKNGEVNPDPGTTVPSESSSRESAIGTAEPSESSSRDAEPGQADPLKTAPAEPTAIAAAPETPARAAEPAADSGVPETREQPSLAGMSSPQNPGVASARKATRTAQDTESNRLRLTIGAQASAAGGEAVQMTEIPLQIRKRMEQIDHELQIAESALKPLVAQLETSQIADPQIETLTAVDERLATAEQIIAELRRESAETPYAFVGLQMVDIGAAQIAPARDRVFALIRQPDVEPLTNVEVAHHGISRARELLALLLTRFERVLREEKLAESLDEAAEMYVVYVEKSFQLLRERREQSKNPLERQMAIVEVDQDYLDRLQQVLTMRRDLMAEFGRLLADDPRLLSRYMDLVKRRQASLRDRLSDLHERQVASTTELSAWRQANDAQREEVWLLAVELRLEAAAPFVSDASRLAERTQSQFPLGLDTSSETSAAVIETARAIAVRARSLGSQMRRFLRKASSDSLDLTGQSHEMEFQLAEFDAALERLRFKHPGEETGEFVANRLLESRELSVRLGAWSELSAFLQQGEYLGMARVDQQRLAADTEMLRIEVQDSGELLAGQFPGEVPADILELARELQSAIEAATFNQSAATFALEGADAAEALTQQKRAIESFARAEELFDEMRRKVIEELDQIDPDDPNIADLQDPTLDEILQRLEREPGLNALLGIPNRPRNLRVISDWMLEETTSGAGMAGAMDEAARQARQRAAQEQQAQRQMAERDPEAADMPEEEWKQVAEAQQAREQLERKIAELRRQAAEPNTDPEQAREMLRQAEMLEQLRKQLGGRDIDAAQWRELVKSDQMRAALKAMAAGESLPDAQWNHILSSLDGGLWQVNRRTPPEAYRKAIEQYQEQISRLTNLEGTDAAQP